LSPKGPIGCIAWRTGVDVTADCLCGGLWTADVDAGLEVKVYGCYRIETAFGYFC